MKRHVLTCALLGAIQWSLMAVPAAPGKQVFTQPDGSTVTLELRGDEYYHYVVNEMGEVMEKDAEGYYRPMGQMSHKAFLQKRKAAKQRWASAERPARDLEYNPAPKGLVIVVSFSDLACLSSTTQASMSEMCNGDNYTYGGAFGSAKKYFSDQSGGTYVPQFDVIGPITLSHPMAYYGENGPDGSDRRAAEAVAEACQLANSMYNINFADYDSDNDELVDFVYMIFAGYGENYIGADPNTIWPHKWSVFAGYGPVILDGVYLDTYACSAELMGFSGAQRCGIGTLCHEFSHVLGLPDYYDTQYGANYENNLTPGSWDIMAGGSHNTEGRSPCNYSVHEKYQFGWATPTLLRGSQSITLAPSSDYYYISPDGLPKTPSSTDTVYYIENRQQRGWDRGLAGHGMMIWRVVYDEDKWMDNGPNDTPGEANYIYIPARGSYVGASAADPFPGTWNVTSWDVPNSLFSLREINESSGNVSLRFVEGCDGYTVTVTAENVTLAEHMLTECCPANQPYIATLQIKKTYRFVGLQVTMGGTLLTEGVDYTLVGNVLTIPSLTNNAEIVVNTEKIPFDHDNCMFFYWHPDSAVNGNNPILDNINWTLSVTGSSYRGFDSQATGRGAQFGSRSTSPGTVVFHTDEMSRCLVTSVLIEACTPDGSGEVEVVVDDETLGIKRLAENRKEFIFPNPEEWHGAVDITFRNLQKALYVRLIAIHFADEIDNPNGLDNVQEDAPIGAVLGIYSMTGQMMGTDPSALPRGLYLVRHTDGTEKILVQ